MKTLLINTNNLLKISTSKYDIEKIQKITNIKSEDKVDNLVKFIDNILTNMKEFNFGKYSDSIFYKYNGNLYFQLNSKYDILRCNYTNFWKEILKRFGLNCMEAVKLTQYMLKIHLKRKIPRSIDFFNDPTYIFAT